MPWFILCYNIKNAVCTSFFSMALFFLFLSFFRHVNDVTSFFNMVNFATVGSISWHEWLICLGRDHTRERLGVHTNDMRCSSSTMCWETVNLQRCCFIVWTIYIIQMWTWKFYATRLQIVSFSKSYTSLCLFCILWNSEIYMQYVCKFS